MTTSMGRLTLNVLLSFAQFEREVTGERIRDKIAASKKKGMWMGGVVPLGYDVENRKLVINQNEAETVRHIFRRYLDLGNVRLLRDELERLGIVGKVRNSEARPGGAVYSRGALYHLLSNCIYIGQTRFKGVCHEGQHEAIIDPDLWALVQANLEITGMALFKNIVGRKHASSLTSCLIAPVAKHWSLCIPARRGADIAIMSRTHSRWAEGQTVHMAGDYRLVI